MKLRELFSILALLLGFGLSIANYWFLWDLLNYFQNFVDGEKASKYFCFWLPYYIGCIKYSYWSLAFDILLGLNILAIVLIAVASYILGKYKE
jgi:hypothetical protein